MDKQLTDQHYQRISGLYQEIQALKSCTSRMESILSAYVNSIKKDYSFNEESVTIDFDTKSIREAKG